MASHRLAPLPLLLAALLLASVLTASPRAEAGQVPETYRTQRTSEPVSMVWLPHWSMAEALASVRSSSLFGVVSPFWYNAVSCRRITGADGAGSRQVIDALRERGRRVLPTITASGLTPREAVRCFGNAQRRAAHVAQVVRVVTSRAGYAGVDIDYEHLALTIDPVKAQRVRTAFSRFVEDLCAALDTRRKACHITVMPRTSDRLSVWRGKLIPAVFDYARIGAAADRVRVMAYDQHAGEFGPGPVAGFPWVKRVADYALRQLPPGRLVLGIPTYARDFTRHDSTSLTARQALKLARDKSVRPHYDRTQRELVFRYRSRGVRHTVWISNRRAVADRYALAKTLGLAGAAYWAAGMEEQGTWAAVAAR